MKFTLKDISANAIIAALYVSLTLITYPISFVGIQFRLSEMLVLLCFFNKKYTLGCTVGCLIANFFSTIGIVDAAFGTAATLISCLIICFCKHLAFACIFPVVINAFVVGFELYQFMGEPFWFSTFTVAMGELVVMIMGWLFFFLMRKRNKFFELLLANQNVDFKW